MLNDLICRCNGIYLSDLVEEQYLYEKIGSRCGICLTQSSVDAGLTDLIYNRNQYVEKENSK